MARLANFNAACETLLTKPNLYNFRKTPSSKILGFTDKKTQEFQEHSPQSSKTSGISLQTTRRAAIGLGILTLTGQLCGNSLAEEEGNGLWLNGPLPIPTVVNKIANEETGTRSFLKNGIYIANIGPEGSAYRLRKYAFDLLGLGDLIGQDAWSYMRRYLRLKSTFMYYDFDTVISAAPVDNKQPLTDLANRLFDSVEKLEDAVKKRDDPQIKSCYDDTTAILQEVMTRMA
ncbi:psbQ-like 1 [Tasmannia lanceolata]|uniref:psbQ-like 1 n=1 Tax=Tasmannia lanceolata TaxID=3420 RepID=UPI0040642238